MVNMITVVLLSCLVYGIQAWGPSDCAFSIWSEWRPHSTGFQLRTRQILREARQGGQPCVGRLTQYRAGNGDSDPDAVAFLLSFLAGNAPSYSLGGGRFYTLSRDLVVLLDTTVHPVLFPYYKSLVSNLMGNLCGEFGEEASEHRVSMATFDTAKSVIHRFSDNHAREIMQDKALKIPRSEYITDSNIVPAADFARTTLLNENSGTRRYNNATKEVLLVTSYTEYCSRGLQRALNRLRTAAEVFILVIGQGAHQDRPQNWCLETFASTPTEVHFRQLKHVADISEISALLLNQSPVNHFCDDSSRSPQH